MSVGLHFPYNQVLIHITSIIITLVTTNVTGEPARGSAALYGLRRKGI